MRKNSIDEDILSGNGIKPIPDDDDDDNQGGSQGNVYGGIGVVRRRPPMRLCRHTSRMSKGVRYRMVTKKRRTRKKRIRVH